jgi:uncharacterized membrane protein
MTAKEFKIILAVGALVSLALLLIGIFIRAGIELPLQGMSYGLVPAMLKNPGFIGFHLKAFTWFFLASTISSSIAIKYAKKTS